MSQFYSLLRQRGWTESDHGTYRKGEWHIVHDTSHWLRVTSGSGGPFDVPLPSDYDAAGIISIVERLCSTEDERHRYERALLTIKSSRTLEEARRIALDSIVRSPLEHE